MKEELIRIEHGVFRSDTGEYRFDISVFLWRVHRRICG